MASGVFEIWGLGPDWFAIDQKNVSENTFFKNAIGYF